MIKTIRWSLSYKCISLNTGKEKNINSAEIGREGWIVTLGTDLSSGSFGDTHSSKTTPIYAVPSETMVTSLS